MQQPQANAMPSARRRSPAARALLPLPSWPSLEELQKAAAVQIAHMAMSINDFDSTRPIRALLYRSAPINIQDSRGYIPLDVSNEI